MLRLSSAHARTLAGLYAVQPATMPVLEEILNVGRASSCGHLRALEQAGLVRRYKNTDSRLRKDRMTNDERLGFKKYVPLVGARPFIYALTPAGEEIGGHLYRASLAHDHHQRVRRPATIHAEVHQHAG